MILIRRQISQKYKDRDLGNFVCACVSLCVCVCAYVNESQSLLAEWETEETYLLLIMIWIEDKLNQGSKYQTKLSLLPQNL